MMSVIFYFFRGLRFSVLYCYFLYSMFLIHSSMAIFSEVPIVPNSAVCPKLPSLFMNQHCLLKKKSRFVIKEKKNTKRKVLEKLQIYASMFGPFKFSSNL